MRPMTFFLVVAFLGPVPFGLPQAENAKSLVGKWKLTKTADKTVTSRIVEYSAEGKLKIVLTSGGMTGVHDGAYEVKGDKLFYTVFPPGRADDGKRVQVRIAKLTDKELHLEFGTGPQKEIDQYERLPAKKP